MVGVLSDFVFKLSGIAKKVRKCVEIMCFHWVVAGQSPANRRGHFSDYFRVFLVFSDYFGLFPNGPKRLKAVDLGLIRANSTV